MQQAFDSGRGTSLTAGAFERLSADERAERSAGLECPECGAQVFFRRRSRDGRAPCFYSLEHESGCSIATPHTDGSRARARRIRQALDHDDRLRLRFGRTPSEASQDGGRAKTPRSTRTRQRPPQKGEYRSVGKGNTAPRTGLGELLDYLVIHPELADSSTFIETEDGYTWRARNLLRRFSDADPDEDPLRPHLFFGPLTGASWDLNWLHTGRGRSVRIRVRPLRRAVLDAQGYSHPAEFAGVWAIVFGRCYRPENGAPPYIEIHRQFGERRPDPAHLHLRIE